MNINRISPLAIAPAIASLVLAIGVATVFSACGLKEDGTWMNCHDAQVAVMWISVFMAVILAIVALLKNGKVRACAYAIGVVGSVITFLVPGTLVSMCMMQSMRCYVAMQPFVRIMSAIIFVLCIAAAVQSWRKAIKGSSK